MDGIWFNKIESIYKSGDKCKLYWKNIVRPKKVFSRLYIIKLKEQSGNFELSKECNDFLLSLCS